MSRAPGPESTDGAVAASTGASPRRPAHASRAPRLIATAVAFFAVLSLVAATTGTWHGLVAGLQNALIPGGTAQGVVRGLVVSLSIGLLLLSRGLALRQRRAWAAAVALTATATVLFVLRDLDVPAAFLAGVLLFCLWYWREQFRAVTSARRPARAVVLAVAALTIIFAYGVTASIWHAASTHLPWSWTGVLSQTGWGMIGQETASPPSDFWQALVASLTVGTVLTVGWLVWALLRPPRGDTGSSQQEWLEARRLVQAAGDDSLAYFALRRDKRYFFNEQRTAFVAYRAVSSIALASGDPIGEAAGTPALLERFMAYCHGQGWRVAAIGVGEGMRAQWEQLGLRTIYVGDEAIVDPAGFSLEGHSVRKVRQSVNRLERLGYRVEVRRADELDAPTRVEVERVSEIWRGGQPERGFSMALDDVRSCELDDTVFVLGRGPEDALAGFLHFVPVPATGDLSLSAMRRLPDTPNGFNEFLVSAALAWARERGIARVSLNFAAFGSVLREEGSGAATRVTRGALRYTDRFFQLERLLNFNRKFAPEWVPRYLAVESRADIPEVGLVVLHLEKLLARGDGAAPAAAGPLGADAQDATSAGSGGGPEEPEAPAD